MNANTIPKSLHTVRVLVVAAQLIIRAHGRAFPDGFMSNRGAVESAADELGYGSTVGDPYGLLAKAIAQLNVSRPYGARPGFAGSPDASHA